MKKILFFSLILSTALFGTACTSTHSKTTRSPDQLMQETWLKEQPTSPAPWLKNNSLWLQNKPMPAGQATLTSQLADKFTDLDVNAPVTVQIDNTTAAGKVWLSGEYEDLRQIHFKITQDILYITSSKLTSKNKPIYIHLNGSTLKSITTHQSASVEGKQLNNRALIIDHTGTGHITLLGNKLNVTKISSDAKGDIILTGVEAPNLTMTANNSGNINLSGKIGVSDITNTKDANITIIGVNSDSLEITNKGSGTLRLNGYANLKNIDYSGSGNIYFYWVNSNSLTVHGNGKGHIGLAGLTDKFTLRLDGDTIFEGKYLRSNSSDINVKGNAHANVQANKQLFLAARENGSIYYFGQTTAKISEFTSGAGTILHIN